METWFSDALSVFLPCVDVLELQRTCKPAQDRSWVPAQGPGPRVQVKKDFHLNKCFMRRVSVFYRG